MHCFRIIDTSLKGWIPLILQENGFYFIFVFQAILDRLLCNKTVLRGNTLHQINCPFFLLTLTICISFVQCITPTLHDFEKTAGNRQAIFARDHTQMYDCRESLFGAFGTMTFELAGQKCHVRCRGIEIQKFGMIHSVPYSSNSTTFQLFGELVSARKKILLNREVITCILSPFSLTEFPFLWVSLVTHITGSFTWYCMLTVIQNLAGLKDL